MSRTDKDRPFWVQNSESGIIEHDHRGGVCIVSNDQRDNWHRARWHNHWRNCKKREVIEYTCTRADPHHEKYRNRQTCWKDWRGREDINDLYSPLVWHHIQCIGHSRVEYHNEIPCACDDKPEPATCTPNWVYGRSYYSGGVPSDFVRDVYHRPERRKARDAMDAARRDYNENGDVDDWDYFNRPARNSARWLWW